MKDKAKQKRIRLEEERRRGAEQESSVTQRLRKWKRATTCLGIALAASIGAIVPFLEGHALHEYFAGVGKPLIYLSMCLLSVFMYAAGTTYNFWSYLRALRNINGNASTGKTTPTLQTASGIHCTLLCSHTRDRCWDPYGGITVCVVYPAPTVVLVRQLRGQHLSTWPWWSRRSSMALTAATSRRVSIPGPNLWCLRETTGSTRTALHAVIATRKWKAVCIPG